MVSRVLPVATEAVPAVDRVCLINSYYNSVNNSNDRLQGIVDVSYRTAAAFAFYFTSLLCCTCCGLW